MVQPNKALYRKVLTSLLLVEELEDIEEKRLAKKLKPKLAKFLAYNDNKFTEYYHAANSQKEFARLLHGNAGVDSLIWPAPIFAIFKGRVESVQEWVLGHKKRRGIKVAILDEIIRRISK